MFELISVEFPELLTFHTTVGALQYFLVSSFLIGTDFSISRYEERKTPYWGAFISVSQETGRHGFLKRWEGGIDPLYQQ